VEEDGVVFLDGKTGSRTVAGGRRTGRTDGPIGAEGFDKGLDVVDIEGFVTVDDGGLVMVDCGVFTTVDDDGLDEGLDGGLWLTTAELLGTLGLI
jgi:hypothetical protein